MRSFLALFLFLSTSMSFGLHLVLGRPMKSTEASHGSDSQSSNTAITIFLVMSSILLLVCCSSKKPEPNAMAAEADPTGDAGVAAGGSNKGSKKDIEPLLSTATNETGTANSKGFDEGSDASELPKHKKGKQGQKKDEEGTTSSAADAASAAGDDAAGGKTAGAGGGGEEADKKDVKKEEKKDDQTKKNEKEGAGTQSLFKATAMTLVDKFKRHKNKEKDNKKGNKTAVDDRAKLKAGGGEDDFQTIGGEASELGSYAGDRAATRGGYTRERNVQGPGTMAPETAIGGLSSAV